MIIILIQSELHDRYFLFLKSSEHLKVKIFRRAKLKEKKD